MVLASAPQPVWVEVDPEQMGQLLLNLAVKVIYMSGYAEAAALGAERLGWEIPFLQKPFAPETLVMKIRELLHQ